jgi:K+-sensing histidine kinase KdpD
VRDIELTLRRESILATSRLSLKSRPIRELVDQFGHLFAEMRRTSSVGHRLRMARPSSGGISEGTLDSAAVRVDSMALHIVFAALIDNAIHYATRDGMAMLAVSVERREAEILLVIADDGPGVEPDLRSRIFEAGIRGRPTTFSSISGRGMGLHDARLIMQKMGGELQLVESQAGATFVCLLPRDDDDDLSR